MIMSMITRSAKYGRWLTEEEIMNNTRLNKQSSKITVSRSVMNDIAKNTKILRDLKPTSKDKEIKSAIELMKKTYIVLKAYVDPSMYPGTDYTPST